MDGEAASELGYISDESLATASSKEKESARACGRKIRNRNRKKIERLLKYLMITSLLSSHFRKMIVLCNDILVLHDQRECPYVNPC